MTPMMSDKMTINMSQFTARVGFSGLLGSSIGFIDVEKFITLYFDCVAAVAVLVKSLL